MPKVEETWFLTATIDELRVLEDLLADPHHALFRERDRVSVLKKVQVAIDAAENWENPIGDLPVTRQRGELPDA